MRCHPIRWLWGLIPLAMLSWLAVHAQSDAIERDLEERSAAALSAAGYHWASVAFSGRDGLLIGRPANKRERDEAAELVRSVWGVRIVTTRDLKPMVAGVQIASIKEQTPRRLLLRDIAPLAASPTTPHQAKRAHEEVEKAVTRDAPPSVVRASDQTVSADIALAEPVPPIATPTEPNNAAAIPAPAMSLSESIKDKPPQEPEMPAAAAHPSSNEQAAEAPPAPPLPVTKATEQSAQPNLSKPEQKPAMGPPAPLSTGETPLAPILPMSKTAEKSAPSMPPKPEQKPVADTPATTSAAAAPLKPPLPEAKADNQSPPQAPPRPERKPAPSTPPASQSIAPAITATQAPPPPERKLSATAVTPPAPERKMAAASPSPAAPANPPLPVQRTQAAAAAAPSAAPSTRFETAALPQSNIGASAACVGDVRGAAQQVEVHFDRGNARLDRTGKALIDRLIGTLNTCPGAALRISGHADATGRARRNLALSQRRARGVAAYITDKGIDAGRLAAVGYGDTQPVAPNDTRANQAKNRRIEVTVTARDALPPPMPIRKQGAQNGLSRR